MSRGRIWMVAAVAVVVLGSCDLIGFGGPQGIQSGLPVFSVDLFEDNIRDAFTGQSVGFTYAIAVGGTLQRSDGVGSATVNPDGVRAMNVNDKMHIASISKTITTIAVLRLIQDTPGLERWSSIGPYLPSGWAAGPGVWGLSFENLLVHESGFSFPANQSRFYHADLRSLIGTGVVGDPTDAVYSNSHHSLFRVIIPEVLGTEQPSAEPDDVFYARVFGEYVQEVILDPLGITAGIVPPATPNLYYAFPHDGTAGLGTGANWTFTEDFGAYGWYLSVIDLVNILTSLHHTEELISSGMRAVMNQEEMGYWNSRTGDKGRYLLKQGGWAYTVDSVTKGVQSIAGYFPGGVSAAVIVNSRTAAAPSMANIMRDAFDASFVDP